MSTEVYEGNVTVIYRIQDEMKQESRAELRLLFHVGFLLGLFFDREDGGDMLLRQVGSL
jgi:hypothetical protein